MQNPKLILFDSVVFNTTDKTMHILDGSLGFYDYRHIKRAVILNERANHRGKSTPFLAVVPKGPGRPGVLLYSFFICWHQNCDGRSFDIGHLHF